MKNMTIINRMSWIRVSNVNPTKGDKQHQSILEAGFCLGSKHLFYSSFLRKTLHLIAIISMYQVIRVLEHSKNIDSLQSIPALSDTIKCRNSFKLRIGCCFKCHWRNKLRNKQTLARFLFAVKGGLRVYVHAKA